MNLVAGEVVQIYTREEVKMAKVRVRGTMIHVPLTLVPVADVGDCVLVESGVAIAKIENRLEGDD